MHYLQILITILPRITASRLVCSAACIHGRLKSSRVWATGLPFAGLSVTFNTDQDEYVGDLTDGAGIRVVVHNQTDMPFPEDESVAVLPGTLTYIGASLVSRSFRASSESPVEYFVSATVAKYCDEYVCLFVCLSARITQTQHGRSSPFFAHAACGHGSVLFWRRCDTLSTRTSGFVDDITLSQRGANGPESSMTLYFDKVH